MSRWPSRAFLPACVFAVVFASCSAACTVDRIDASACGGASDATIESIAERLAVDGELRHGFTYTSAESGTTFVSAEIHLDEDDAEDRGDILTWATTDPKQRSFVAVDERARELSEWPGADDLDARTEGVVTSRGCTDTRRGQVFCDTGTGEQVPGVEAECPDEAGS